MPHECQGCGLKHLFSAGEGSSYFRVPQMQYFNIVVLLEKLYPSELPVSTVEMSDFRVRTETIIFERVTFQRVTLATDPPLDIFFPVILFWCLTATLFF